ncbi:hypothetical protein HN51_035001 [Arachis hypogaea]|uniref:CR-type domain-containing protein n=1 Tax=Arachis hypogaea TaxID=3818 RepID=A0A445A6C9_ARAHY|nr:protein EMBRYO SAC DEVELOPMENT ARREST 3, chloroplastic [Arachis ipaensis]XP_025641068.1 protein PHOTOSYSTEM I ASSEMBLY 2, chloroplastic [Arachis hypogaea]QHN99934.1 uncharacterized protein DS421_13g402140 [Arachis hypogaea]RYR21997.1 hypothetical protein Ahy_B03g067290 [Arachis hypogaea]
MSHISVHCCNNFSLAGPQAFTATRRCITTSFAAKSGGFSLNSILKGCETCSGKGAIECPGCKGTGKNKKNGNIFERWKCFDCQGFGLKSCPSCGKGGLTPEQRGER